MKKISMFLAFLLFAAFNSYSQQFEKPTEGKARVYFVRFQGALALLDFKYFDGQKYLGKASGNNYYMYECDPGEHVFWVAAENKEYIKGNLKPNSTYVIEVRPYMRAVMAGVKLYQISPTDEKTLKKMNWVLGNSSPAKMDGAEDNLSSFIENGMENYKKNESKAVKLNSDWSF